MSRYSRAGWAKSLFALSLAASATSLIAEESDVLQYQDAFNLEFPASMQFINDDTLIYSRQSMDIMTDGRSTKLWQIDLDDGSHTPFLTSEGNIGQATLSPDKSKLAYTRSVDGKSQLFVYHLTLQKSVQLTNVNASPRGITWSNDGSQLAFSMFTPASTKPLFTDMPAKPKGANWADNSRYIDSTRYRADGAGFLPGGFNQIFILPVDGGTPRQLTKGEFPNGGTLSFSKDDEWIFYSSPGNEDYSLNPLSSDIFKVNTTSGDIEQVTSLVGPESTPKLSPNGKWLAFTHVNDRKLSHQVSTLNVLNLETNDITVLTPSLDRGIGQFEWQDNSKALVFSYEDHGNVKLANVTLSGNFSPMDVAIGGQSFGRPYTSGEFALSEDGDIVYTTASVSTPADIALYRKGKEDKVLTQLNNDALGHLTLARVEAISVKSSVDDITIDAWIAYPPHFDSSKTYPLILEIHGGPHAAYGPHFSTEIQLMAAQGYVVVWANPRGSSSYGEDFGNLIHHNYPSQDYNDLMDVVDQVIANGSIDEKNLFITGGSGGGTLTAWSIGKTDRFAAAVVAKPVINWMSFALTADAYPYFSQYWMPQMPWEIADELWQRSPLSLVGNVTTPTMLLTGEADFRTPMSETEQYYQALKLQGVDAAMVRIPGASHGIASRPSRLIQKVGNIVTWFERYKTEEDVEE